MKRATRWDFRSNNFYMRLNVPRSATGSEISSAFKVLSQLFHPDASIWPGNDSPDVRASREEIFKLISEAYTTLKNPRERAKHNRALCRAVTEERRRRYVSTRTPSRRHPRRTRATSPRYLAR